MTKKLSLRDFPFNDKLGDGGHQCPLDHPSVWARELVQADNAAVLKFDKLVKSQIPMAKKKTPPNLKFGKARKS